MIRWSLADLGRKLHAIAAAGPRANPEALAQTLKIWGPQKRPLFDAARRTDAGRLRSLLGAAVAADHKAKTGSTPAGERRAVETLALRFASALRA